MRPVIAPSSLLLATVLSLCFAGSVTALSGVPKPNILVILIDDMGWGDVGYHNPARHTPHIDRLAAAGVRLEQHYVASSCSPTRAAFHTGRYWSRFGCTAPSNPRVLPFDTFTLPRALKQAGYETCLTGKWHLGSDPAWNPNVYGYDHSYGSLAGGVGPYDHRYKTGPYSNTWHRDGHLIEEKGHVTDLITNEAVNWIGERGDKPWFLYVPFTAVHIPVIEEEKWLAGTESESELSRRHFLACLGHLDFSIGRLVDAVEKTGHQEKTLIVFFSDNGAYPNAVNADDKYPDAEAQYPHGPAGGTNLPLRGQKTQIYEGGIRVPAFFYWPAKLHPGVRNFPTHVVDLMPTLCGLAGVTKPDRAKWDGHDIWPLVSGAEAVPAPRRLYWVNGGWKERAVREGDWKLISSADGKQKQLFNLAIDPNETQDLASTQADKVATLSAALAEESAKDKDAVPDDQEKP